MSNLNWEEIQEYKKLLKGVNVAHMASKLQDMEVTMREALEKVDAQNKKISVLVSELNQLRNIINTMKIKEMATGPTAIGSGPTQK